MHLTKLTSFSFSLVLLPLLTLSQSLPPLSLGTLNTCSPSRYPINYAAFATSSQPCTPGNPTTSSITQIGAYPISNAGCGLGSFTVAGYENVTFEGCTGPPGPYPTRVLRDGVVELSCQPVSVGGEQEVRLCEGGFCEQQGTRGELRVLVRCTRVEGEEEDDDEEDEGEDEGEDEDEGTCH